jgi:hypothetical protein
MTTRKWQDLALWRLPIDRLIATQPGVYFHALYPEYVHLHDQYPHVIWYDGEYYLEDGHSRVMKAMINGETHVMVRILFL